MRLLIVLALALPAASSAAPRQAAAPLVPAVPLRSAEHCSRADIIWADKKSDAKPKRLGDLPAGAMSLGVMREVEGCIEPTIVRYGYGAAPASRDRAGR